MVVQPPSFSSSRDLTLVASTAIFTGLVAAALLSQGPVSVSSCWVRRDVLSSRSRNPTATDQDATSIRNNRRLIQSVLNYWFGEASPDINQKSLWMIQDPKRLKFVDQEIFDKFGALLEQLMNKDGMLWSEWCHDADMGYTGKIAAIIVLDQFSRHIRRHCKELTSSSNLPDQTTMDERALETSQLFVTDHSREMDTGMIPLPMYIFALMPFRHASTLETVQFVHDQVEDKLACLVEQSDTMVRRFRKATNRRLAVLQGDKRRTGGGSDKLTFTDEDILEATVFEADLGPAKDHSVHTTICKFLEQREIRPVPKNQSVSQKISQVHPLPIIISLSGGVDSMVIASVLANLVRSHGYETILKVVAVHIDYANRPESKAEASFVERWCEKQNIDFYCRRIDEVTRGVTARDEYEAISRDARYTFYQKIIQQYRAQLGDDSVDIPVVLGHHRGDLRENVLSNAHKGCGPLDLSGMTSVCKNQGVTLFRPLLTLEKSEIFDYSHKFGVPYFKDTTPDWSTRGKLRNKLLPLLQEIYGEGCLNNLSQLAVESDQCRALVHRVSLQPFLDEIQRRPMGIRLATRPYRNNDLFFWKVVLREALHSASLGMFSEKSIESVLVRIQTDSLKEGWLQCRKDYAVYLQADGHLFILYPHSFPWRKSDQYDKITTLMTVSCPSDKSVHVGPWLIDVEVTEKSTEHKREWDVLLDQRAFSSMDDLMGGSFSYFLRVPGWEDERTGKFGVKPLVFRKFIKSNRPKAWKGIDTKVQDTLPLLGCGDNIAWNTQPSRGVPSFLLKISYRLATS